MKEKLRDIICIVWAYFGALTLGTMYMLADSGNITGSAVKIYNSVNKIFSIIYIMVLICYFGLIILNIKYIAKGK